MTMATFKWKICLDPFKNNSVGVNMLNIIFFPALICCLYNCKNTINSMSDWTKIENARPSGFRDLTNSKRSFSTNRGPLLENWMLRDDLPFMCCYKLVTCNFKWWGLQRTIENAILKNQKKLFQVSWSSIHLVNHESSFLFGSYIYNKASICFCLVSNLACLWT